MKSLRGKLFVAVGSIFLIVSLLSYVLPRFFVKKDVDKAAAYVSGVFQKIENKAKGIAESLIIYQLVHSAVQLEELSKFLETKFTQKIVSLKKWASRLIMYEPETSFVQINDPQNMIMTFSVENGQLYLPEWAAGEKDTLWIRIPEKDEVYLAVLQQPGWYFLYSDLSDEMPQRIPSLSFIPFRTISSPLPESNQVKDMYRYLLWNENQLALRAEMIQKLANASSLPIGVLKTESSLEYGVCLLTQDVFLNEPIIQNEKNNDEPFLLFYRIGNGSYLDLVRKVALEDHWVWIGISVSRIAKQVAKILHNPVLLSDGHTLLGFARDGSTIEAEQLKRTNSYWLWEGKQYLPHEIRAKHLTLIILTSEATRKSFFHFMAQLRERLIDTISYNLLLVSLALLGIALLLLARISKRITRPIALLAKASEEIGKGKYEHLQLPRIGRREDEVAVLSHSFEKMVESLQDREKIRGVLNKVVSEEIAGQILSSEIELGGEERTLTMLFSDIRGFTPLCEYQKPRDVIGVLNEYMTRMCRIIDQTHGVVDKFVGDEIMALYGAPLPLKRHADQAVEAALLMVEDLKAWNEKRRQEGKVAIEPGIGIHSGIVFAGNMGAESRLNYTVIGANVNLAARLCAAAQPLQILISESTWEGIVNRERFRFVPLSPVTLKGFETPVGVYEVVNASQSY